jgi:hypothetical protein
MAKTMHLEGRGNCKDEESAMRRHAYMNVTTALNKALNGENGGYGDDIDKTEVAKMIDKMLVEKKGVVGKGGYMERATSGRITRGLKRMWEREPSFDYDGSLSEWNQWRKAAEEEKRRIAAGGAPKGGTGTVEKSIEKDFDSGTSTCRRLLTISRGANTGNRYHWRYLASSWYSSECSTQSLRRLSSSQQSNSGQNNSRAPNWFP